MSYYRTDMDRCFVVLIILLTISYLKCDSSAVTEKIHSERNNCTLGNLEQNNRDNINKNSQNGTLTLIKITNEQSTLDNNMQFPLTRSSRTVLHKHKSSCCAQSKHNCKYKYSCKKEKFALLHVLFSHCGEIMKSFILEIGKVLTWWDNTVKNLKNKMKEKQIGSILNKEINAMYRKFPSIKKNILNLIGYFSAFFNFNSNAGSQLSSRQNNIQINETLKRIKYFASSFIMLLKGSQMIPANSNGKLAKVENYFHSIPTDEYDMSNHRSIDGSIDMNLAYTDNIDAMKNQFNKLQIIWEYIIQLPTIFTSIFEIIGELFIGLDSKLMLYELDNSNHLPLQPSPSPLLIPLQPPGRYPPEINQNQFSYGSQISVDVSHINNNPSPKIHPPQLPSQGTTYSAHNSLAGKIHGFNSPLSPSVYHTNGNILYYNGSGRKMYSQSVDNQNFCKSKITLDRSSILLLLGTSQFTIGDIVIFNLSDNVILVGRIDDNVSPISFNKIYRTVSQKSSYSQRTAIWNLSCQHLSSNSQIYNDIIGYLTCE